ncbi:hypothetical protein AXG93_3633s1000 [Marchantia polymorpha subsp. ruderalis]|uniref:Ricin B lectin domain-containing protein n=1 Tax=Marchantia polymorpha subsp. ruderalis TaxID=1480154 RepID=A0A176W4S4_MARPO|nr:hypothetical protein AXG93_3633s1000 [Marchantia polymorpha subsp. ruderalis]
MKNISYPDQPLSTCYYIQTVYARTPSAICDDGAESDHEDVGPDTGPVISNLDQADKEQLWFIEPSTEFAGGCFRFRNANTNGYLYEDQTYGLQSKPVKQEERRQNWVLQSATSGRPNVPVGIPLIHSQFRISNLKYNKVIHAKLRGDKGIIGLQNEVTLHKDQVFMLILSMDMSSMKPGVYFMRSVYTGLCVSQGATSSQSATGNLSLVPLNHGDTKQAWGLVLSTIQPGFYRLQNVASAECVMRLKFPVRVFLISSVVGAPLVARIAGREESYHNAEREESYHNAERDVHEADGGSSSVVTVAGAERRKEARDSQL